jgi:hypothetical protein
MKNYQVPEWLMSFNFTISDSDRNILFGIDNKSINHLSFEDDGCVVGSHIFIDNMKYTVAKIHVYFSKNENTNSSQSAAIRVDIIV